MYENYSILREVCKTLHIWKLSLDGWQVVVIKETSFWFLGLRSVGRKTVHLIPLIGHNQQYILMVWYCELSLFLSFSAKAKKPQGRSTGSSSLLTPSATRTIGFMRAPKCWLSHSVITMKDFFDIFSTFFLLLFSYWASGNSYLLLWPIGTQLFHPPLMK
jgi:hypothetical protein